MARAAGSSVGRTPTTTMPSPIHAQIATINQPNLLGILMKPAPKAPAVAPTPHAAKGSMGLRAIFVAPLAVLVLTGRVQMWEVYAISIVFGIVDAFFMPARQSILPKVVADHELEPGNAVLNVTMQASIILGPALGGVIVGAFGTGWAFAADAACFAIGFLFIMWLPSAERWARVSFRHQRDSDGCSWASARGSGRASRWSARCPR